MNYLFVFVKKKNQLHIFSCLYGMNTHCNFVIQQTEDSLAVQTLNTIIFFFPLKTSRTVILKRP